MTDVYDLSGKPSGIPHFGSQAKLEVLTATEIAQNQIDRPIVFHIFFERVVSGATFGQVITLGICSLI